MRQVVRKSEEYRKMLRGNVSAEKVVWTRGLRTADGGLWPVDLGGEVVVLMF